MSFRSTPWRSLSLALLLAPILLIDRSGLRPDAHGQKPMFPVQTRLELLNAPEPGGVAQILVSVAAWAPGEDLAWNLDLPDRLTLIEGETGWSGRLGRGESRSFVIGVRIPDGEPYEISARARIVDRARATSGATLPIDLGEPNGPKATERLVPGDGTSYIQYQGEVTPREGGR